MLIALEGADGVGKSTLFGMIAEKLDATPYTTPPKKYLRLRTRVDKDAPADEHYRFYREGIYDASNEIRVLLKRGGRIVADRYWLTTYTYHQIMGASVSVDDFKSIVMPTLTIILSLNYEAQIERMLRRGMSAGDRRMLGKEREIAAAFYRNVLEFNIPFLVLDTQRFSPKNCVDIVVAALKS